MKFTLLVVGRTVEKHYITAINDYVERTKHFISFDMVKHILIITVRSKDGVILH